jgi:hypothetical protein
VALLFNITGSSNTALGSRALENNSTGNFNTATGVAALSSNAIGIANTATGADALLSNSEGSYNTAIGASALELNTGDGNTACGSGALFNNIGARGLVTHVEKQCARTNRGVVAAVGVAKERKPSRSCVRDAGGEVLKGIASFRRVETGITSVRRRTNRLHLW